MVQCVSILGSTGSIGRQTLEVAEALNIKVGAISVHSSVRLAEEQARKFKPYMVAVVNEKAAEELKVSLADTSVRVVGGKEGLLEAAVLEEADTLRFFAKSLCLLSDRQRRIS